MSGGPVGTVGVGGLRVGVMVMAFAHRVLGVPRCGLGVWKLVTWDMPHDVFWRKGVNAKPLLIYKRAVWSGLNVLLAVEEPGEVPSQHTPSANQHDVLYEK